MIDTPSATSRLTAAQTQVSDTSNRQLESDSSNRQRPDEVHDRGIRAFEMVGEARASCPPARCQTQACSLAFGRSDLAFLRCRTRSLEAMTRS